MLFPAETQVTLLADLGCGQRVDAVAATTIGLPHPPLVRSRRLPALQSSARRFNPAAEGIYLFEQVTVLNDIDCYLQP